MEMREAILKAIPHGFWVRPITWRGRGEALLIDGDYLCLVPGSKPIPYALRVKDLLFEWEVVDPDTVAGEA